MLKIPFHSCSCCGNGEVVFPNNINPFLYFYDKKILGIYKTSKNVLIFQNKIFKFTSFEFKTIDSMNIEINQSLNKKACSNFSYPLEKKIRLETYSCGESCTAHIIENDRGHVQLKYDYSHIKSGAKSFEYFWNVEFKRNNNKYILMTRSIELNNKREIFALVQDNCINSIKCYSWKFGVVPIFKLLEHLKNLNFKFVLKTYAEISFILINSNFIFEKENFHYKESDTIVFSVLFNLIYIKEKDLHLYGEIKKIDQNANYIMVFANRKRAGIKIIFDYLTISQGIKTIEFYKNKNFFRFIL